MAFLKTLIGDLGTTAGNHRCKTLYEGSAPCGHGRIPSIIRARRADGRHPGTGAAYSHQLVGPVDLCHQPADRYSGRTFWHAHLPMSGCRHMSCHKD